MRSPRHESRIQHMQKISSDSPARKWVFPRLDGYGISGVMHYGKFFDSTSRHRSAQELRGAQMKTVDDMHGGMTSRSSG